MVYQILLKQHNITQSISAKGSSVDNVPIESFFSALKSECIYLIKNLKVKEIDQTINNYINYYNNERLQEKIKELTPFQFRESTLNSIFF
jgi:transposase InsO family protein